MDMRYVNFVLMTTTCVVATAFAGAEPTKDVRQNDDARRFADASAKVAKAELDKALESNRKAPGAITAVEIERLQRAYELAALGPDADPAKRAAAKAALAKAELDKALEANRAAPGAITPAEMTRLRDAVREKEDVALREEVKALRDEVRQLRESVRELQNKK